MSSEHRTARFYPTDPEPYCDDCRRVECCCEPCKLDYACNNHTTDSCVYCQDCRDMIAAELAPGETFQHFTDSGAVVFTRNGREYITVPKFDADDGTIESWSMEVPVKVGPLKLDVVTITN